MLLCMLLMYTTAHVRIRQQSFETFWDTHHLFIPFFLGLYTHTVGCFVRDTPESFSPFSGKEYYDHCLGYLGWRWELVTGGLYLVERLYREVRAMRETKITRVLKHPYSKHQWISSGSVVETNRLQTSWKSNFPSLSGISPVNGSSCKFPRFPGINGIHSPLPLVPSIPMFRYMSDRLATSRKF